MSTIIKKEGFPYAFDSSACASCGGRCCTGESGNIFVNAKEIASLSKLLKLDSDTFKAQYLIKKGYKYSLKEKIVGLSYDCIFYSREAGGCSVYMARPLQCRTFPFWEYYKNNVNALKLECPGIIDV